MESKVNKHHHHILTNRTIVSVGLSLLVLTVLTVAVAHIDLGRANFLIAFAIATLKGLLVALFFMNLRYDRRENGVIFGTAFLFLAIFIVLTGTDLFFRGDVYVKGPIMMAQAKSKIAKPWISTPDMISHGRELFAAQCVACHGPEGKGNGPAASALNPHPRNFTAVEGWKNGRKPSQIFKTLETGVPGSAMASFATLSTDDRWALVHFVESLSPQPLTDTPADLAKIGIDVNKAGGGAMAEKPTIPVDVAMDRLTVPELKAHGLVEAPRAPAQAGAGERIYLSSCYSCHGPKAEGGINVQNLGVNPKSFVTTQPLGKSPALQSYDAFSRVVSSGLSGEMMLGNGQLSSDEMHALYQYVRGIAGR